jgi:hypothetical protein
MASEPSSPQDLAWVALAEELAPAKSLTRLDAATARVVTNVTVVGTLLTGLGILGASLPSVTGWARGLAVTAVVTAALAVVLALSAQVVTVTRIRTGDLLEVQAWYRRRVRIRGPLTVASTVLLAGATAVGAGAAVVAVLDPPATPPTIAVTRTTTPPPTAAAAASGVPVANGSGTQSAPASMSVVAVEVTLHGLDPGEAATVTVSSAGIRVAQAAFTATPDGIAARTLSVGVPVDVVVAVEVAAGPWTCRATLTPERPAVALACTRA